MASDTPNKAPLESGCLLKFLYTEPKYSDLIIKRGNREFHVHRVVVCTQSSFFANACKGDWQESKDGIIELHDEPSEVIAQIIQFLYLLTYEDSTVRPESPLGPIQLNLKVFMAADKYDVPALAEQAQTKFESRMSEFGNSRDFISTVRELYEDELDITKAMRQTAIETAVSHANALFEQDSKGSNTFRNLMAEFPKFGAEVMAGLLTKFDKLENSLQKGTKYQCHSCEININVSSVKCSLAYCPFCRARATQFW